MNALTEDWIIGIAKGVATANNVQFADVVTRPAVDSMGFEAIEIKFVLTPGSSKAIMGERSAITVSQLIQKLADAGESRFPIVRYEEQGATSPSR